MPVDQKEVGPLHTGNFAVRTEDLQSATYVECVQQIKEYAQVLYIFKILKLCVHYLPPAISNSFKLRYAM